MPTRLLSMALITQILRRLHETTCPRLSFCGNTKNFNTLTGLLARSCLIFILLTLNMRTKQDMKLVQLQRDVWNWDFVFLKLLPPSWHPDLDAMGCSFLFTHAVAKAKAYFNIFY